MINSPTTIEAKTGIERTEKGDLILSYFMLCFAVPDDENEMRDWETGAYTNVKELKAFPFPNSKPSKESVEECLKTVYGECLELLEMRLERQQIKGKIIWQRPGIGDNWL